MSYLDVTPKAYIQSISIIIFTFMFQSWLLFLVSHVLTFVMDNDVGVSGV